MILEIRYLDLDSHPGDGFTAILKIPVTHQTTYAHLKNAIANQALDLDLTDWRGFDRALNDLFSRITSFSRPAFPLLAPGVEDSEQHHAYFAIIEGE